VVNTNLCDLGWRIPDEVFKFIRIVAREVAHNIPAVCCRFLQHSTSVLENRSFSLSKIPSRPTQRDEFTVGETDLIASCRDASLAERLSNSHTRSDLLDTWRVIVRSRTLHRPAEARSHRDQPRRLLALTAVAALSSALHALTKIRPPSP
jgi:hypothetical protein